MLDNTHLKYMKNFKPNLVSCVIPSYKWADHIIECIESVLNQDYNLKEIIVIIQKFPWDFTFEICSAHYGHMKNIFLYQYDYSMFPSKARNLWIQFSQWEYICILDDDDVLLNRDIFTLSVKYLKSDLKCWLTSPNSIFLFRGEYSLSNTTFSMRLNHFNFSHSWSIFRQSIWELVGFYNENYRVYEDLDFFLRICGSYNIINISGSILKRIDPCSISFTSSSFGELFCWIKVTAPYIFKYPGFLIWLCKKLLKIFIPRKIQILILLNVIFPMRHY